MQILSTVLVLVGIVIGVLGLIGAAIGKVPLLKLKGRGLGAGMLVGGLALLILGGTLAPKRGVVVTASPTNATILIDGQKYTGTTGRLALIKDSYEVEVSAPNHHALKQTLDTSKQQTFTLKLKPFTAEELATVKRQAEEKAAQARRAKLAQEQATAAAAKVEVARVAAQQQADKVAAAQATKDQAVAQAEADLEARKIDIGTFLQRCEKAVRAQLKVPDSAEYPNLSEQADRTREYKDGTKVLTGSVKALNPFGVKLSNTFTCSYSPETLATVVRIR